MEAVDVDQLVSGESRAIEDALHGLGSEILLNMKATPLLMEELYKSALKYHKALEVCVQTATHFIECFSKVADRARYAHGGTNKLGESLQNLLECQRIVEEKRMEQCTRLKNDFITPLVERCQSDRVTISKIEKRYEKETRRGKDTLKKVGKLTLKAAERAKKGKIGARTALEEVAIQMSNTAKEFQRQQVAYVSSFFIEERSIFIRLVESYRPVVEAQYSEAEKAMDLNECAERLHSQCLNDSILPVENEEILQRIIAGDITFVSRPTTHVALDMNANDEDNSDAEGDADEDDDDPEHTNRLGDGFVLPPPPPHTHGVYTPSPALSVKSGSSAGNLSAVGVPPPPPPPPSLFRPRSDSLTSSVSSAHSNDHSSVHSGPMSAIAAPPPPPLFTGTGQRNHVGGGGLLPIPATTHHKTNNGTHAPPSIATPIFLPAPSTEVLQGIRHNMNHVSRASLMPPGPASAPSVVTAGAPPPPIIHSAAAAAAAAPGQRPISSIAAKFNNGFKTQDSFKRPASVAPKPSPPMSTIDYLPPPPAPPLSSFDDSQGFLPPLPPPPPPPPPPSNM